MQQVVPRVWLFPRQARGSSEQNPPSGSRHSRRWGRRTVKTRTVFVGEEYFEGDKCVGSVGVGSFCRHVLREAIVIR